MKKLILLSALLIGFQMMGQLGSSFSQWNGSQSVNGKIFRNGFVGIGNTNPWDLLHVGTSFIFHDTGHSVIGWGFSPGNSTNVSVSEYSSEIRLDKANGRFSLGISASKLSNPVSNMLVLYKNGNVGIGTDNPDEKLTVKGKIHAEEVRVDLSVPADYVFQKYYSGESLLKPEYIMPTLEEVEAFTKANNHLPEMPSAKEIQENGFMLKEITNLLLQKVEELTIYTIEQEKRINSLELKLNSKEQKEINSKKDKI